MIETQAARTTDVEALLSERSEVVNEITGAEIDPVSIVGPGRGLKMTAKISEGFGDL